VIEPAASAVLDSRARLQAEAAVDEAEAGLDLAKANLAQAEADFAHANAEYDRNSALVARGILAQHVLDDAQIARDGARSAVTAAGSRVDLQQAVLVRMQAELTDPAGSIRQPLDQGCCIKVLAPITGTILALENSSARFVLPGASLMKIGDLSQMEVEVDLLSADAVRVTPGAVATLEGWGGDTAINAIVKRVEPSAFTRISALGIEEQRVRVQLDIPTPPAKRPGLGDNFRVFVRIVIWQQDEVLQVPIGALFRNGDTWAVFQDVDGTATLTPVEIGRQSDLAAQVLAGLAVGARIVVYPGSKVTDGTRIAARAED
jgi:HlyD family secretion protein